MKRAVAELQVEISRLQADFLKSQHQTFEALRMLKAAEEAKEAAEARLSALEAALLDVRATWMLRIQQAQRWDDAARAIRHCADDLSALVPGASAGTVNVNPNNLHPTEWCSGDGNFCNGCPACLSVAVPEGRELVPPAPETRQE
jgi:hypothetical protein